MELDPKRRARILDAAAKLIVANGLQCSMAAIAEQAGVATGSIYNYFKSKDDMVRGVYTQLADTIAERLIFPDAEALNPRDRIFRYIYDYIDFMWEDHDRAILFEYLSNVPLISPQELVDMFEETNEYSIGLMTAGKAAGFLSDIPSGTLAGYIGGGIRNTLKWRRAAPPPLTEAEKLQIALISWNTIAVPGHTLDLTTLPARELAAG
ncbi:TetR/AcrR family transcriptional regulator [Rhizobium sp. C4]|uniref:TetR/AcrR family transcriptional regulator n=1 Tax=Rhizobium sp. C4 TaxID=1349800 RepID=UPI001E42D068|nr:TetR/AcrR family transcriptional regulator [Rhizobium sp. C4]MCD2172101.1 TetR/AcrR family transcriptional regulator [Rhizobium sp. C4]